MCMYNCTSTHCHVHAWDTLTELVIDFFDCINSVWFYTYCKENFEAVFYIFVKICSKIENEENAKSILPYNENKPINRNFCLLQI